LKRKDSGDFGVVAAMVAAEIPWLVESIVVMEKN